jgi:hypothetical protein
MNTDPPMKRLPFAAFAGLALLVCAVAGAAPGAEQIGRCTASPNVPLPDLVQRYRGLEPGLYPGAATRSDDDAARGRTEAARIVPRDVSGNPSAKGQIVLFSIGMSNAASEFGRFIQEARNEPGVSKRVTMVNGALSGADATMWTDAGGMAWQNVTRAVRGQISPAQVQTIWMKHVHLQTAPFPDEIERLAADMDKVLDIARSMFPNLRIVYMSSRTRSGATTGRGPSEPQAYETAFAVRRLIERQRSRPGVRPPWVTWGPYLWANAVGRSDGLTWECEDLQPDLLHPSESGNLKVAQGLLAFFMADATTASWFVSGDNGGGGDSGVDIHASAREGRAPLAVDFGTNASWPSRYYWTFGDGTWSLAARPRKTFFRDGVYDVRLTVTDATGRVARSATTVRVER